MSSSEGNARGGSATTRGRSLDSAVEQGQEPARSGLEVTPELLYSPAASLMENFNDPSNHRDHAPMPARHAAIPTMRVVPLGSAGGAGVGVVDRFRPHAGLQQAQPDRLGNAEAQS